MDERLFEELVAWDYPDGAPPDFWAEQSSSEDLSYLDGTIWKPRKKTADAKDYVDHLTVLREAFRSDWAETSGAQPQSGRSFGTKVITGAELRGIRMTVEAFYPMLIKIFNYYSHMGADITCNINGVGHMGFVLMLQESRLGIDPEMLKKDTKHAYARHAKTLGEDGFELIWISVNESKLSQGQTVHNSKQRLTRAEFIEVLV